MGREREKAAMDDSTRREFVRSFGVALLAAAGGRALLGCRRGADAVDGPRLGDTVPTAGPDAAPAGEGLAEVAAAPADVAPSEAAAPDAASASDGGPSTADVPPEVARSRARVRELWTALLPDPTAEDWRANQGNEARDPRPAREAAHRRELDALVAAGDLRAPVADLVQAAFGEVSFHAWRTRLGATCYDMTQLGWQMQESRERLRERARALDELVRGGAVPADAVADARAALAREIAVVDAVAALEKLERRSRWEKERALSAAIEAGGLAPDDDELEAAGWLAGVLLSAPPPAP